MLVCLTNVADAQTNAGGAQTGTSGVQMGTPSVQTGTSHVQTIAVNRFHKVIISPYIQARFLEANEESVTIEDMVVDPDKLHVEVSQSTLRVYLDGAKDIPHYQKEYGYAHLYPDHAVVITVRYKKMDALSLRGAEKYLCESPLTVSNFRLKLYGETTMIFTEVHIGKMRTSIYGESTLDIRSGDVQRQYYTSYGEGKVYATAIVGRAAKVMSFGEAEFNVNVSDRIKVAAIGEAKLRYMGNPAIVKGLHIGDMDLKRLD